jgi:tetratricopeptide (TPR) repeat protein
MANTTSPEQPHLGHDDEAPKSDLMSIIMHIQARPWPYLGAVGFVIFVLVVTGLYRASQATAYKKAADQFARALDIEDPKERATALGTLADEGTALTARALYLQGESALEAGDHEGARAAFTKLRESFPDYEFIPESVEGLALIAEDAGDFAGARGLYEEVLAKWPDSPAAKRQPFNIARCLEGEGQLAPAVERYRDQLETFPGSTIAVRAQARLDEMRVTNPELFPAETTAEAPAIQELQTAPDATAAPAPDTSAAPAETTADTPAGQPTETPPATPEQ